MINRVLHKSVKMLNECYNTRIFNVSMTGQKTVRQMHFLGRLAPPYPTVELCNCGNVAEIFSIDFA